MNTGHFFWEDMLLLTVVISVNFQCFDHHNQNSTHLPYLCSGNFRDGYLKAWKIKPNLSVWLDTIEVSENPVSSIVVFCI